MSATLPPLIYPCFPLAVHQQVLQAAGVLVLPENPSYDTMRQPFNQYYGTRHPGLVVRPTTVPQVQAVVACLRSNNTNFNTSTTATTTNVAAASVGFRVRGGGHSYGGFSTPTNGSVLLDLGRMTAVIGADTTTGMVEVESGIRLGDLYDALWREHGLMVSAGTCRHVGAGGHGQGGGFGYISRTYGMFSDSLVAFEVVLPNATVVTANGSSHQDLFWALRGGGGGNFGVVTKYTIAGIVGMPRVVRFNGTMFKLIDPKTSIPKLLHDLQLYVPSIGPRFNFAISVADDFAVRVDGHWVNGTEAELKASQKTLSHLSIGTKNLLEDTNGSISVTPLMWQPAVPSAPADVRTYDDVITFGRLCWRTARSKGSSSSFLKASTMI